ncbi:tRNA 4-thiouridine(8) synthase ThiI [Candidatus Woesearchaeota archaeon]|nr:tRNA 4-thiouridine(8) synthase ThiI [Candidatus Woesearchaeota archaeon]
MNESREIVRTENILVIHYSEIGTKGDNRSLFEQCLVRNIKERLGTLISGVQREYGRIIVTLPVEVKQEEIFQRMQLLPGVAFFAFAYRSLLDTAAMKEISIALLKQKSFITFKVDVKRSNKLFPQTSQEIANSLGDHIRTTLQKNVNLTKPDQKLFVEIGEKNAYLFTEKHYGTGGLPVGSSGKIIASLSGGIDSPVASFLMMKRGCTVIFVHIYNETASAQNNKEKIQELVTKLASFQGRSKLHIVPFGELQRLIIAGCPAKSRMILYRRLMMRILNSIAKQEKARAIVTGDSIGQVASQTLENLQCIYDASTIPILTPLSGMNKDEIIALAQKIKTYDISIQSSLDCCSFMIAKNPETKARLQNIIAIEQQIAFASALEACLNAKETIVIGT